MRTHEACYWENKSLNGSNGEGVQIKLFKAQKRSVLLSDEILYGEGIEVQLSGLKHEQG